MKPKSFASITIGILLALWAAGQAAPPPREGKEPGIHDGRGKVIVRFRETAGEQERAWTRGRAAAMRHRKLRNLGLEVLDIRPGATAEQALAVLQEDPSVEYAEPNARVQWLGMPRIVPSDGSFGQQRYLDTQPLEGHVGTSSNTVMIDFDIDAPEGWAVLASAYAGSLMAAVGVLDSGCGVAGYFDNSVGYVPSHQDLPNAALFANTVELSDIGIDSPLDPNNLVDDVNGWDFIAMDAAPADDVLDTTAPYHGTAISGIVAAAWGDTGIAGVAGNRLKVLPLRSEYLDEILAGIDYAIQMASAQTPTKVLNASWKFDYSPRSLRAAIISAQNAGIAIVAAAGNGFGGNNDDYFDRIFPAEYTRDPGITNVLSVAASADLLSTNGSDYPGGYLADFSNYGPSSVQVAAPGENIFATAAGTDGYLYFDGTSFSAPIAASILAHVMAVHPGMTPAEAIDRVINGGDFDARLSGLIQSGKRVNLAGALAPFYPYSGLAYLDTRVPISMYADTVSSLYGSVTAARLSTSLSTAVEAATLKDTGGRAWAVSPVSPGIASFVLSFEGASAPVGSYETGPWRVTAIRPFMAVVRVGDALQFQSLLPAQAGTVSWSLFDSFPKDTEVGTIDAESGLFTAATPGWVRVMLAVNGDSVDNTGWILVQNPLPTSSGGGGGGGCFVATATWGRRDAPQVRALRTFRDRALLTNEVGRRLVDLYYRHSPPAAAWLDRHPSVKPLVRAALGPVALMAWLLTSMWGVALASVGTAGWLLVKGIAGKEKRESKI